MGGRRRSGLRRRGILAVVAVSALVTAYLGVTFVQVLLGADADPLTDADAIVVLGAAQYDGVPSPVLERRLDHALDLYRAGIAPLVVTTGANQPGDRFTEGYAGYRYLRDAGVPDGDLLVITTGASTYEQLAATARELGSRDAERVVLVSDPYHSVRLHQIADEVGLDALVSPTSGGSSLRQLARETAAVALGRVLGYRRVDNWLGSRG